MAETVFCQDVLLELESQIPASAKRMGLKALLAREADGTPSLQRGNFPFRLAARLDGLNTACVEFDQGTIAVNVLCPSNPAGVCVARGKTLSQAMKAFEKWDRQTKARAASLLEALGLSRAVGSVSPYCCELYGREGDGGVRKVDVHFAAPEGAIATVTRRRVEDVRAFGVLGNETAVCGPEEISALPFANGNDLSEWFATRFVQVSENVGSAFAQSNEAEQS